MSKPLPPHPIVPHQSDLYSEEAREVIRATVEAAHNKWFKQKPFANPENEDIPVEILAALYPEMATLGPEHRTIIKAFDIIRKLNKHLKKVKHPKTSKASQALKNYLHQVVKQTQIARLEGILKDNNSFLYHNIRMTFFAVRNKRIQKIVDINWRYESAIISIALAIHTQKGHTPRPPTTRMQEQTRIILTEWLKLEQALLDESVILDEDLTGIELK